MLMTSSSVAAQSCKAIGLLMAASLCLEGAMITIGGMAIADNGGKDLDPAADSIKFDSTAAGALGFAIAGFSEISGTVKLGGGDSLVQVGGPAQIVTLTDLFVLRADAAGAADVNIVFEHGFGVPAGPGAVMAADGIKGNFTENRGFLTVKDHSIKFQGFVNGNPIVPLGAGPGGGPYMFTTVGGALIEEFAGGHGPMPAGPAAAAPAAAYTLKGELDIHMVSPLSRLRLPNSADVGISAYGLRPIPEPAAGTLVLTSLALFLGYRRRTN